MLFDDYQILIYENEDDLHRALHQLALVRKDYDIISKQKRNLMAFKGIQSIKIIISIDNHLVEKVFQLFHCDICYDLNYHLSIKLNKFQYIRGTICLTVNNNTRWDTILKFYETTVVSVL